MSDVTISATEAPPPRALFQTKTAFAAYALATAGAVSAFFPDAVPWVNANSGLIMMAAATVNIAIRHFTHERVTLFGS